MRDLHWTPRSPCAAGDAIYKKLDDKHFGVLVKELL